MAAFVRRGRDHDRHATNGSQLGSKTADSAGSRRIRVSARFAGCVGAGLRHRRVRDPACQRKVCRNGGIRRCPRSGETGEAAPQPGRRHRPLSGRSGIEFLGTRRHLCGFRPSQCAGWIAASYKTRQMPLRPASGATASSSQGRGGRVHGDGSNAASDAESAGLLRILDQRPARDGFTHRSLFARTLKAKA